MKVDDYMIVLDMGSADVIPRHKIDVSLIAEGYNDLADTVDVLQRASASNGGIVFGSPMPVPEKIFRCGDATTVIWADGTKTIVKLMPGADDSDYGAFTAALAKKIYGNNSKVMRYAGMVQRVKSKAEKKAERKAKHKAESENQGEKKYIVSQYGQVAECKGIETDSMGVGEKVIVSAKTHDKAREKAYAHFVNAGLGLFSVSDNGRVEKEYGAYLVRYFGVWRESLSSNSAYVTAVFARSLEEALKIREINPAPKEGGKP